MLSPDTQGPDDKRLLVALEKPALSTTFGSLTAILAPHVGCCLYGVTPIVASLGEVEGWWQVKEIRSVKTPKGPKLVKASHLGCRECKCGLICWQQELTE